MKRINGIICGYIFLYLANLIFLPGGWASVFALSREEYNVMAAKSQVFRDEARKLDQALKEAMSAFSGPQRDAIRNAQSNWLKSEVDKEARQYMDTGVPKEEAYARACARRASLLNIMLDDARLTGELPPAPTVQEEGPERLWADNCGMIKGDVPIKDALHMLLLANEEGKKKRYYYFQDKNAKGDKCGSPGEMICFSILEEMPVSPKLRQAGVRGFQMTIIDQCGPAYKTSDGRVLAEKPKPKPVPRPEAYQAEKMPPIPPLPVKPIKKPLGQKAASISKMAPQAKIVAVPKDANPAGDPGTATVPTMQPQPGDMATKAPNALSAQPGKLPKGRVVLPYPAKVPVQHATKQKSPNAPVPQPPAPGPGLEVNKSHANTPAAPGVVPKRKGKIVKQAKKTEPRLKEFSDGTLFPAEKNLAGPFTPGKFAPEHMKNNLPQDELFLDIQPSKKAQEGTSPKKAIAPEPKKQADTSPKNDKSDNAAIEAQNPAEKSATKNKVILREEKPPLQFDLVS